VEPTATPTETPVATATPTELPTAAATLPPAATATLASNANVPGTYTQSGTCFTMNAHDAGFNFGDPTHELAGLYVVCVPSVVVRASLELQVNITWLFTRDGMHPDLLNIIRSDRAVLPADNGSVIYLQDNLGRQLSHVALEGAPRDGASGGLGAIFSGSYLFPAAQASATTFILVDTHRRVSIGNITLAVRAP
jgi:hypothetical protein